MDVTDRVVSRPRPELHTVALIALTECSNTSVTWLLSLERKTGYLLCLLIALSFQHFGTVARGTIGMCPYVTYVHNRGGQARRGRGGAGARSVVA